MVRYNKFVDWIIKGIDFFIAAVTAMVIFITILSVVMRYAVNQPFAWTEEICLGGFSWFTFMGAGSAIRKRSVVSLDFLYDMLSGKNKKIVKVFTTILCVVAYAFIIFYGFKILGTVKMTVTPSLRIPYSYVYLSIPLGGIISILALIANLFDVLMDQDKEISEFSEEAKSSVEHLEPQ